MKAFLLFCFLACPAWDAGALDAVGAPNAPASAANEILPLVGEDAGLCLIVRDLRGHAQSFMKSAFVREFRKSPVGVALAQSPEAAKLHEVADFLETSLGVSWDRLRDDILGDVVVLAYRPGAIDHPEEEEGVLLLRARDAGLLSRLIQRINDSQVQAGEISQVEVRYHAGTSYLCRIGGTRDTSFCYLHGPLLAWSSQENAIKRVIARDRGATPAAEPLMTAQLQRLGCDASLVTLWINPRRFDADIEQKTCYLGPAPAAVVRAVLTYWKALDGLTLDLRLEKREIVGRAAFLVRGSALPPAARKLFQGESRPAELWARLPERSLLTVAGRFDGAALCECLRSFLPEDMRQGLHELLELRAGAFLGKDIKKDVLPLLGPDWGFCVTAPRSEDKTGFPRLLLALRVRPGDKAPPLDRAIYAALDNLASVAVAAYNGTHSDSLVLKTEKQGKVEVRFLASDGAFPAGLRPAFALKGGYLVLGSSPEAIRAFRESSAGEPAGTGDGEFPFLRLSIQELRRFVSDRLPLLAERIAQRERLASTAVVRHLGNLVDALQFFDRLEVTQRTGPDQLVVTVRLHALMPVRK